MSFNRRPTPKRLRSGLSAWRLSAVALFVVICAFSLGANAKDLSRRLGLGYANQFGLGSDLPSLALRYYPNQDFGLMGAVGVDTTKNNSRFGFQIKLMKTVFREDNLNFYTGASAALISHEIDARTNSGFAIAGFVGAEFFFTGLENLGFNFEAGVGVTSLSSDVRFQTIGDSPLKAGLFFYF